MNFRNSGELFQVVNTSCYAHEIQGMQNGNQILLSEQAKNSNYLGIVQKLEVLPGKQKDLESFLAILKHKLRKEDKTLIRWTKVEHANRDVRGNLRN